MLKKLLINEKKTYLLFTIIIIISILLITQSMSKYVLKAEETPHIQESTSFYFESDFADVDGKEYYINNWDGEKTQTIKIDVSNYINNLLKTNENITYKIKAQIIDESNDSVDDEDLIETIIYNEENVEIKEEQELVLSNTEYSQEIYKLNVIPKVALQNEKTFNIELTISSIKPYTKELKANIKIKVENITEDYTATLTNSENGEYVVLNLKVNNISDDITVEYDNTKLILDKSYYLVNNVNVTQEDNMNSFVLDKNNLEKNNYEINFIKIQDGIIFGTDIIVI